VCTEFIILYSRYHYRYKEVIVDADGNRDEEEIHCFVVLVIVVVVEASSPTDSTVIMPDGLADIVTVQMSVTLSLTIRFDRHNVLPRI
jgi:hypothetical protein